MQYTPLPVGEMQANAYIIFDEKRDDCLVVDPGAEPVGIELALAGRKLSAILLTHGHFDHIGAVSALRGPDVPVYIHEEDAPMLSNPNLSLALMFDGQKSQGAPDFCFDEGPITLAGLDIAVLHTPGHTGGSCCFRIGDVLFSGDTLFRQGVGRTDLPGGDHEKLQASLKRLLSLDAACVICPGHGPATTIGEERRKCP